MIEGHSNRSSQEDDSNIDLSSSSANKLRALLERRKLSTNKSRGHAEPQNDSNMLSMEDMATILHESDVLTKGLEEQIVFYQDSLAGLRLRTEQVVSENELLHERLKDNLPQDGPARNNSKIKFGQSEDKKYLYQLENELDEVKRLNQDKTSRLEAIIKSTREELHAYKERVSKLQSQLRAMDNEHEQKHDNICIKCGRVSYFSSQPSMAQLTALETLTKERDELTETLTKHKSLLAEYQQREFDAYMEVKKSAEIVENAKLEKAEAIIKIKQLESSIEEERIRHESLVSNTNEKWKRDCDDIKEKNEEEKQTFQAKIQVLTQKCDENEHLLDKLTREKVNLLSDLEKLKAELAASHVEIDKIKQDAREEVISITRERVNDQQEYENLKNIQARQLKEHEQIKVFLTTENEGLRKRLSEAQSGWLETREENLRIEERLKQLENELHLLTLSKSNLETAYEENREFFKKQEEQREQQFLETVEETEQKHAELHRELEELLQAQMKMSTALRDENKRLIVKLEEKKENHRSEKTKWRDQLGQLASELETSQKQLEEVTSAKENLSQINDELAGKVKFLRRENKKDFKMIYNLLKKQKDLMLDRRTLSHELESLQRSQTAATPYQREIFGSQAAGNISANEPESDGDTSCRPSAKSNVEVNNESESL